MPVKMVLNEMAGKTVFTDEVSGTVIEWDGAGDPDGNDVQPVPEAVLQHPMFMRAMRRGIYREISDEEAEERLDRQAQAWTSRMDRDANAGNEFIELAQQNDITQFQCVGPSPTGQGRCQEQVMLKEKDLEEVPPLCGRHQRLKGEFIPVPDPNGRINDNGRVSVTWTRAQVG